MILRGDALDMLRTLPDGAAQTCVTSPPYWGLRDYGVPGQIGLEPTPDEYVARLVAVFREVRRVLKDDGTLWLNLGDSFASDTKGSGGPSEKQLSSFHSASQRLMHGLKPKDLCGIPWRVAFALQADGWWLRSDIIWAKPNPMPESVTDRPTKAHEYLFLLAKAERYYYDGDAIREPHTAESIARRGRARTGGKYLDTPGGGQPNGNPHSIIMDLDDCLHPMGANRRSVWTVATHQYPEAHFATFPPKLIEPCILAGSRPGDTVLDPFAGAGTTLLVAQRFGRQSIGIELNADYLAMADRRLGAETPALRGLGE